MALNVSPELQSLVMSMLDANPCARPSAEEVNRQVGQLWSKDPVDTKMDSSISPAQELTDSQATPSGEHLLQENCTLEICGAKLLLGRVWSLSQNTGL